MKERRVVIAGGGTGGHVFLSLAIADALVRAGVKKEKITLLGSKRGQESELVPRSGYGLVLLSGRGVRRSLAPSALIANIGAAIGLARAVLSTFLRFVRSRPTVVVSVGGYGAFSGDLVAVCLRIPLVLVTIDSVPGLVHRLFGSVAQANAVAFSTSALARAHVTGTPLREGIRAGSVTAAQARQLLGLVSTAKVIAVVGGSLGAGRLNDLASALSRRLDAHSDWVIYHVTGRRNYERVANDPLRVDHPRHVLVPFCERMDLLYSAADLFVGRAGGSTIAELCACSLPSLLVPLPHAPGDHQRKNADLLERAGASVMIEESTLSADAVEKEIDALLGDPGRLSAMSQAARSLCVEDAATKVAEVVLTYGA